MWVASQSRSPSPWPRARSSSTARRRAAVGGGVARGGRPRRDAPRRRSDGARAHAGRRKRRAAGTAAVRWALLVGGSSLTPPLVARAAALLPRAQIVHTCVHRGRLVDHFQAPRAAAGTAEEAAAAAPRGGGRRAAADDAAAAAAAQLLGALSPSVGRCRSRGSPSWTRRCGRCPRAPSAGCDGRTASCSGTGGSRLSAAALADGGWLLTGDLGVVDGASGELRLVGRIKDVIKTGASVHAAAVERAVLAHPRVARSPSSASPTARSASASPPSCSGLVRPTEERVGAAGSCATRTCRSTRGAGAVRDALPRNSMGRSSSIGCSGSLGCTGCRNSVGCSTYHATPL